LCNKEANKSKITVLVKFERFENLSDKHLEEWWQTSACEPGLHYLIDADLGTASTE
jgi:hypothetical protein